MLPYDALVLLVKRAHTVATITRFGRGRPHDFIGPWRCNAIGTNQLHYVARLELGI